MIRRKLLLLFCLLKTALGWAASHHPQDFLRQIIGSPDEGKQIVQHYCANCHSVNPVIQLGAPRIGQLLDWEPRIKQGIDNLFKNTDEGFKAMPSRGGCFECTDHQLLLAILAMLPEKQRKIFELNIKLGSFQNTPP